MKLAYMAHPLGPEGEQRQKNLENASKWFAWLHHQFQFIVFSANWIVLASQWDEATGRKRGLEIDEIHVERSDLFFLVGGKVSEGMARELRRAQTSGVHVVDLTFFGFEPPELNLKAVGMLRVLQDALVNLPNRRASSYPEESAERVTSIHVGQGGTLYYEGTPHPGISGLPVADLSRSEGSG